MTTVTAEKKREYNRAYYQKHKARLQQQIYQRRGDTIERNNVLLDELRKQPCADCNKTYPAVCMDFDHLPGTEKGYPRKLSLSTWARGVSMKRLEAEIAKCEVVCANCHRIRTQERLER